MNGKVTRRMVEEESACYRERLKGMVKETKNCKYWWREVETCKGIVVGTPTVYTIVCLAFTNE